MSLHITVIMHKAVWLAGLRSTMGNMLRQVVAPLHERGFAHDPFVPVSDAAGLASLMAPDLYLANTSDVAAGFVPLLWVCSSAAAADLCGCFWGSGRPL